jgi:hypothetical protein
VDVSSECGIEEACLRLFVGLSEKIEENKGKDTSTIADENRTKIAKSDKSEKLLF